MLLRILVLCLVSVATVAAQDVKVRLELVLVDDPATQVNEAKETIKVLNNWRKTQIIGLTQDGDKIFAFNNMKEVLAEELNRYVSAILSQICDNNVDECPAHLKGDYMTVDSAVKAKRRKTKDTLKVE